jgi:hypothetical protein
MRNTKTLLIAVTMMAVPLTSMAGKSDILHCGCNDAGDGLVTKIINVNNNACKRGHTNHVVTAAAFGDPALVTCTESGSNRYFNRTIGDQEAPGNTADGHCDALPDNTVAVDTPCGSEVVDPS